MHAVCKIDKWIDRDEIGSLPVDQAAFVPNFFIAGIHIEMKGKRPFKILFRTFEYHPPIRIHVF